MTTPNKMPQKRRESRVDHARHDPATALASLFRPITRGRRPGGLEIKAEFDDVELTFQVWRALDTRDQSVLLATVGMAGMDGQGLDADAPGDHGQQLWLDLDPQESAQFDRAVVITTTRYALLQAAGLPDQGSYYGVLEDCLTRLSNVGCRAKQLGHQWSMNMLSWAEAPDGRLTIALNGRFAAALGGHHVRVSLHERHQLDSDTAQVTHAWLSAWLRAGQSRSIGIDKLAAKVWGDDKASDSAQRKRRERLHNALDEIASLPGWRAKREGRGTKEIVTIDRPRILEKN